MKQQWKKLADTYEAKTPREKALLATAILAVIWFIGDSIFVSPQLTKAAILKRGTAAKQEELNKVRNEITALMRPDNDPDQANRAALNESKKQLEQLSTKLRELEATLVAADKVPQLLSGILVRSKGMRLIGLQSLPTEGAVDRPSTVAQEGTKPGGTGKPAQDVRSSSRGPADILDVYKHGVEIKIEGNYSDLLGYITALEALPYRMRWGTASLQVAEYP